MAFLWILMTVVFFELGHGYRKPAPMFESCRYGHSVLKGTGSRIGCNSDYHCPKGSTCNTGRDRGSCCLKRNRCKYGNPYNVNGDAVPCRGPNKVSCPAGYTCQAGDYPLHSVCCPEPRPCAYGKYYKDNGAEPSCYSYKDSCPRQFVCNGAPGYCCRKYSQCPLGRNPYRVAGDAPNCLGPNAISCPTGYSCVGGARSSSVCCPGKWCLNGRRQVYCGRKPCGGKRCWRYPRAVCVMDTCGRCSARFFYQGREVTRYCRSRRG